ncbi:MAG: hypothetical protein BWY74_00825 [Firmicutes bacterium ADurb.Bin419]|nr:MAG: hypothetical protein BWY74_00825 [Firmicutes bacterium ADurb.Bin419]
MLIYFIITSLAILFILVLLQMQYENGFRKGREAYRKELEYKWGMDYKEKTKK